MPQKPYLSRGRLIHRKHATSRHFDRCATPMDLVSFRHSGTAGHDSHRGYRMECFTHVFITGDTCHEKALHIPVSQPAAGPQFDSISFRAIGILVPPSPTCVQLHFHFSSTLLQPWDFFLALGHEHMPLFACWPWPWDGPITMSFSLVMCAFENAS